MSKLTNAGCILVPSGLTPVHSFDLWGPLVNTEILGEEKVHLFKRVAELEGMDAKMAAGVVAQYRALNRGEPWATGVLKPEIINALEEPLKKHPELLPDYAAALYPDGIETLKEIFSAGEKAIICSTKRPEWVQQHLIPLVGEVEMLLYAGAKHQPEAFRHVYESELAQGRRVVTHTADELPELKAAVASELFSGDQGRTVFVNRNNTVSKQQSVEAGIDFYVDRLTELPYSRLVTRTP